MFPIKCASGWSKSTMKNEYAEQLEKENEELLRSIRLRRLSVEYTDDVYYDESQDTCFSVGDRGECGIDCPLFVNHECEEPEEHVEWINEEIKQLMEYKAKYKNE